VAGASALFTQRYSPFLAMNTFFYDDDGDCDPYGVGDWTLERTIVALILYGHT
jgi:hypothetical protein